MKRVTDKRFIKKISAFRWFHEDTDWDIEKMIEQDWKYSKIEKCARNKESEITGLKQIYFKHFKWMKNLFECLASHSAYPNISWNDFTAYCIKAGILDKNVILSTIDRLFITTNVAVHEFK